MSIAIENKYKDNKPVETVNKIRNILYKLGIITKDIWIDSGVKNCHSLRVLIENTEVGQNGKGVTDEYALASGYAELYERISNGLMYLGDYSDRAAKHLGFYYDPDEKYMTSEELSSAGSKWVDFLTSQIMKDHNGGIPVFSFMPDNDKKIKDAVDEWKFLLPEGFDEKFDFISIPFYDIKRNRIEYFPYSLLRSTYGSNGTCTGNTPYEAIVQGLSEIFERHVNIYLIANRITPPTVPDEYLATFENLHSMIKDIEKKGPYSVMVKDCSLGKGYPVVAVILINYESQTYKVKFGSHPSFEISLERCLTELFQGIHLEYSSKTNVFLMDDQADNDLNIQNIIKVGSGIYPVEFFMEKSSYEFKPFEPVNGKSNKDLMKDLTDKLIDEGRDIYIRDNSYMGFPSFQLIVPGFSEIYSYNLLRMKEKRSHDNVRSIMKNLHNATPEELNLLSIFIRYKMPYFNENNIPYLYGLPMKDSFPYEAEAMRFLLILVLYKLKRFKDSYNEIGVLMKILYSKKQDIDESGITYLRCLGDYVSAKADGRNKDFIDSFLHKFYPEDVVLKVADQFEDTDAVFDHFFEKTNCWDCTNCEVKEKCDYKKMEEIHMKTKEFKKAGQIDQLDCKKYFS